jgi:hypothetical protein
MFINYARQRMEDSLGAIKDAGKAIAGALKEFAVAIEAFWIDLRAQIAETVNALINILANFDPLKAWQGIANLVTGLTGVVTELWRSLRDKYIEFGKVVSQIEIEDADHEGTVIGNWPGPHREFYQRTWTPEGE